MFRANLSAALRSLSLTTAAAVCLGLFGAGNACNVYTTDMLLRAVGGVPSGGGYFPMGGTANGGSVIGGGTTNGGTGIGGGSAGGVAGTPQAAGGAAGGANDSTGGATPEVGGTTATGGAGGSGGTASPSSGGVAGQAVTSTGGAATGGVGATSVGGASGGAAPSGGSGGVAGGGTGGATGVGGATPCDLAIVDDMQDADAPILVCDGRSGSWYSFGLDPALSPPPNNAFTKTLVSGVDAGRIGGNYAATLQGSTTNGGDCGLGFPLRDLGGIKYKYSLFNAQISFWYRTTGIASYGILRLAVPLETTTPISDGGTCVEAVCNNHYAYRLSPTNGDWIQKTIPFEQAADPGFTQNTTWGKNIVAWEPALALFIQFTVISGQSAPYTVAVGPIQLIR